MKRGKITVTMKGFPPRVRTKRMFDLLSRKRDPAATKNCKHKWQDVEVRGEDGVEAVGTRPSDKARACDKCGTIEWVQLEKIRTLARLGFQRDPAMRLVQKSFKTPYSKRTVLPNGSTVPLVVDQWKEPRDF